MTRLARTVNDLEVYQMSFETAMKIFEYSKNFPTEERYSLTDQIRRSSRSVCANLAEAWRRRGYKAFFMNRITDCTQEAAETQVWLEFALRCRYIDRKTYDELSRVYDSICGMLTNMHRMADRFCS